MLTTQEKINWTTKWVQLNCGCYMLFSEWLKLNSYDNHIYQCQSIANGLYWYRLSQASDFIQHLNGY